MTGTANPRSGSTRRADRFWLGQVCVALLALTLVGGLGFARYPDLASQVVALCQRTARELALHGWMALLFLPPLLGALSLFLAGLSIGKQLRDTRRLLRSLGPARPLSPELTAFAQHLGIAGRLRLVTDPRPLAFCAGLTRPAIWLTTGLVAALSLDELAAVLRHEAHHVRHRDPLKLLLVRVLADAFFFLPLVRELGRVYEVHKELAADAEAALGPAGRLGLASALLKLLARNPSGLDGAAVGPLTSAGESGATEARLCQLTGSAPPSLRPRWRSLWLTGLILLLFVATSLSPPKPVHADWGGSCGPEGTTPAVITLEAW